MTGSLAFPAEYIGRPWIKGEFDCWTLVRDVYYDCFGISLHHIVVDPDNLKAVLRAFENPDYLQPWHEIQQPEHLCLVFFTPGHHRATHCGLWLDVLGGRYLHCHRKAGVVFEDRATLEMNGWFNPKYYRYRDCGKNGTVLSKGER